MAEKELSAEELREKLFQTFQSRGILDSLKSQLRNRLVTELQQTAKANLANDKKKKTAEETGLLYHAANSLVADHLEKCNFDYTLSVFLPESSTSKDKIYTVNDFLHLLKVDKESHLYKSLERSSKINPKSFLWEIVCQFSSLCGHNKQSTAVQTDDIHSIASPSVAEKLKFVDKAFSSREERENKAWTLQSEQKILDIQKKCEERKKVELAAEIQRFRASELSRMRLEEKEQCQKAIKLTKEEMERDYMFKAEALRLREKELSEREDRQKKIQEEEAYSQRQNILQYMQSIKERENDFKRKHELQERSLQLEEERFKVETEKVKEKEMALKEQETRVKQKLEDEIQRYKLQHQETYQNRLHDLELREVQFKQNKESFDKSKTLYMGYHDELEETKEHLRQIQSQLEASMYNIASLQQHKDTLVQKLDEVKDYGTIKDREHTLQIEKAELQRHLEEERNKEKGCKNTIKELKDKLSKPSAELVSVRNELKTCKEDAKNKDKFSKESQKKLELRLQQESHRCIGYQRLYEECLLKQKAVERESDDLQAALQHTQTLLRMELERRRFSEASVSDVSLSSPPVEHTAAVQYSSRTRQNSERNAQMNDTGSTQEMIAHSNEVFEKLEKDAKDLEESYRRFQSRMKNTGLEQFTSVPPESSEKHNIPSYPGTRAEPVGVGSNQDKANSQDHFAPLSWVPASDNKRSDVPISYIASGHVDSSLDPSQFLPSLRPLTREDTANADSGTRFYSLPSFGVSELTQNTPAPRYFGLSTMNQRPPNNTVNVSDLIAKPGSPSVISAPIDHSTLPSTSAQTTKSKRGKDRLCYSSAEAARRPLSSTIGRAKEETGISSRDTGFLTSSSTQKNSSTQASRVPVIDGSAFHDRRSDTESENESHRSSDASLSGGYLSMGTLNRPARTLDNAQRNVPNVQEAGTDKPNAKISLNSAWGGARTDGVALMEIGQSLGEDSFKSINSDQDRCLPERSSLDSVWRSNNANADGDFYQHEGRKQRDREERERVERERDREERERVERERDREERERVERERDREERERVERERDRKERERVERDHVESERDREEREQNRERVEHERDREEHEKREQDREEREWEEEKRKRDELRRRREEEAWEQEQRELAELQRQQEALEREDTNRSRHDDPSSKDIEEKKNENESEKAREPDIDPVMLQYMQMIQKKKEEEQKAKAAEPTTGGKPAKEAGGTTSNSMYSQGDEGSLDELSGDDGFNWG